MNILDTIVAQKRKEVAYNRERVSIQELEKTVDVSRPVYSLRKALAEGHPTGIIAEFKRKSPSKGVINAQADVATVTKAYAQAAAGISVLTDEQFFGGHANDLRKARSNYIPILRKDFIVDEYQLFEARAMGADVILLIAACLSKVEVQQLAGRAHELGLEVLLEIHDETELEHVCESVDMVGVNNRNLKTFQVDIATSLRLVEKIPTVFPAVAESGISNVDTIVTLRNAGFRGFLIGENFMKEPNPSVAFADFIDQLKAKQHAY